MTTAASPGCPAKRRSLAKENGILSAVALRPVWLILTAITLAAALLRVLPWLANFPLHGDEALYGTWARLIASGRDPLLLTPWIDKPPLSIYLGAGSIAALGVSELALRLPGMLASVLTIPATYALARRAYGEPAALLAAGLLALSPFAILFAPTAFTDPWLALWLVVAAWAALARRGLAAGLTLGLAVASKQQGVLAAPLVISLLLLPAAGALPAAGRIETRRAEQQTLRRVVAAVVGFALIFGPLTYWDSLRWHNRPSFWDQSLATYNSLGVAAPAEWPGRVAAWIAQLNYLFGLSISSWLMLALAVAVGAAGLRAVLIRQHPEREHWLDLIFAAYIAGYLALHIAITFQTWDRYLLPLVPLVCLLAARGLLALYRARHKDQASRRNLVSVTVLTLLLAGALGYGAWLGSAGRIPVGSDHGAYTGIRQVAEALRSQPDEAILYHRSLGWYFDYYLFDAPQERRWFDTALKLADDSAHTAEVEPGRPQWLIATDWEVDSTEALRPVLAARGLALSAPAAVRRPDGTRSFAIYRIAPMAGAGEP